MAEEDKSIFTTSSGATLKLHPIHTFKLDAIRSSKTEIPAPTYEVTVAGGDRINIPLDEEAAKNKDRLEEWRSYLDEKARHEADYARRFTEFLVWEGVEVDVPGKDSDWQKQCDYFKINVPDEEIPRKFLYVSSELLTSVEDMGGLIAQIMSVSNVDEEVVERIRNSFRLALQKQTIKRSVKKQRRMAGK
jgi:hypothetical protein